jgi:RNA polymerase sigma factor (sigma-70 family)
MSCPQPLPQRSSAVESTTSVPAEVRRVLDATPGAEADHAWGEFLAAYSALLLRAATLHGADYDAVLDRYAYMLDELRRDDCRRLRRFVADGRAGFSAWLAVVARRLCLDHHRSRYGRRRSSPPAAGPAPVCRREVRRRLMDLHSAVDDLELVEDPAAREPVETLEDQRCCTLLLRAVALLSPADRQLLRLRFEQELSAREIAQRLGLATPFHVYRRLRAVCTGLRAAIGGSTVRA